VKVVCTGVWESREWKWRVCGRGARAGRGDFPGVTKTTPAHKLAI